MSEQTPVVELVLFKLKSDTTEEAFLRDNEATFPFLAGFDGYIDRELSKNEDGLWADYVHWRDMASALAASEKFMTDPIAQKMERHLDETTIQLYHFSVVSVNESVTE
jgi:hypothetical protein